MSKLIARALACLLGMIVGVAACQPVDDIDNLDRPVEDAPAEEGERRGAPEAGVPGTIAATLARAQEEAIRWQEGARLAEVTAEVDDDGRVTQARVTYVAPDADRLLAVSVTPEGLDEERPTLNSLDLAPITGEALDALPPLPADMPEPAALFEAVLAAFAACDVGGAPETVLYASGAPLAWVPDEQEWAGPLEWTVTVTDAGGQGAVLDPVSGERLDCVAAPP